MTRQRRRDCSNGSELYGRYKRHDALRSDGECGETQNILHISSMHFPCAASSHQPRDRFAMASIRILVIVVRRLFSLYDSESANVEGRQQG
jgi:hypothetical protein